MQSPARRSLLPILAGALFAAAAIVAALQGVPLADEIVHYRQAQAFATGSFAVDPDLTTIPGFHAVVAAVLAALPVASLGAARGVTMVFALVAVAGFASIRRALAPADDWRLPTAQLLFLPILFPFAFLLYTDVPSLALVVWALRFALDGQHARAGAAGIASLLVRQTNVVWIAFISLLPLLDTRPGAGGAYRQRPTARTLWPYAIAIGAFAGYWLWQGRTSLSTTQAHAHPDFSLHSGNLFLMLFVAAILFAPLLPAWLARYAAAARAQPAWLAVPIVFGILYAATFRSDHPYNAFLPDIVLRNGLLRYVTGHAWASVAFGAIGVVGACALSQVRWLRPSFALLMPVSALFVCASWLIEVRYYITPLALLLALRAPEGRRAERLLLLWWMPLALALFAGMMRVRYFP